MRNDVINMSRARDKEKNLSPWQKLDQPVWCSHHWTTRGSWRSWTIYKVSLSRARGMLITSFLIFSPSFKFTIFIYHTHDDCILPSLPQVLPSSVVRASDPCQKGHIFNSCRGLRFFSFWCLLRVDHVMSFLTNVLEGGVLSCHHWNETSSAVLSHGTIYLACSPNCWDCGWNLIVLDLFSSSFNWHFYLVCSPDFWNLGWNPMLLPFNETSLVELLYGAIYFLGFHKRHI